MTTNPTGAAVLVVDDEPDLRELYELTLMRQGYRIHTAMDSGLQDYAETLWQDDRLFPDGDRQGLEAALVLVDVESGGAAALVG